MVHQFSNGFLETLLIKAKEYLSKGRPGDLVHTLRVVDLGRYIAEREGGDIEMILPALILHDVGWSQVNYDSFLNLPLEEHANSEEAYLHQEKSAGIAKNILIKMNYPPALIHRIIRYIAVHDQMEKVCALKDSDAIICMEADFLDRFGLEGRRRFENYGSVFKEEEVADFMLEKTSGWLHTKTARMLLEDKLRKGEGTAT